MDAEEAQRRQDAYAAKRRATEAQAVSAHAARMARAAAQKPGDFPCPHGERCCRFSEGVNDLRHKLQCDMLCVEAAERGP